MTQARNTCTQSRSPDTENVRRRDGAGTTRRCGLERLGALARAGACAVILATPLGFMLGGEQLLARAVGLPSGDRALMFAIMQDDLETASRALDAGASPNARSEAGYPVLSLAVESGNVELVRELLARGADPNAAAAGGWTPLDFAVLSPAEADVAAALRAAGAARHATNDEI